MCLKMAMSQSLAPSNTLEHSLGTWKKSSSDRGGVRGGREGALAPPDPAQNFSCIKILCSYLFFTLLIFFKVQNL